MPVSRNNPHHFPIEVSEDETQFLVRIPAIQKERASRIPGRRWNPGIERWVYPKTLATYDALTEEFKRDAIVFEIRKPANKRLPSPQPRLDDEDQSLDEWKDLNEKTSEIHRKFDTFGEQVSIILESVRSLEAVSRETQEIVKLGSDKIKKDSQKIPAQAESLDPSKNQDLKLIERALVLMAFASAGRDKSFANWIKDHQPLLLPDRFVSATHEKLKCSIAQMLGASHYENIDFVDLIHDLKRGDLMGLDSKENKRVGNLLFAMNQHRNRFGHPVKFTESERLTRSIIYLFNLALVWPHVASEPVEESNEA